MDGVTNRPKIVRTSYFRGVSSLHPCRAGCFALVVQTTPNAGLVPLLGVVLMRDLLWFAYGRERACDPSLSLPPESRSWKQLARETPGRIVGLRLLPRPIVGTHGLTRHSRIDGIDPSRA